MAAGNKAYALLGDRPILHWTVAAFARHPAIDGILVVTGPADVARCRELLSDLPKVLGIVAGGATRQESGALTLTLYSCMMARAP